MLTLDKFEEASRIVGGGHAGDKNWFTAISSANGQETRVYLKPENMQFYRRL